MNSNLAFNSRRIVSNCGNNYTVKKRVRQNQTWERCNKNDRPNTFINKKHMTPGILFAIIAATVFGAWTVFHQQAASKIDYLFGAIIISFTAVILGLIMLLPRIKSTTLFSNPKGVMFAVFAGACALAIDYFALKSYGTGLAVSVAGPIIIGGSIAVAAIIGLFLGEYLTLMKVLGLILVIGGASILAVYGN